MACNEPGISVAVPTKLSLSRVYGLHSYRQQGECSVLWEHWNRYAEETGETPDVDVASYTARKVDIMAFIQTPNDCRYSMGWEKLHLFRLYA